MVQIVRAFLVMLALVSAGAGSASAARLQALDDATVEMRLRDNPSFGVLIVDLVLKDEKGERANCGTAVLILKSTERQIHHVQTYLEPQPFGLGDGFNGGITAIKPGWHVVEGIMCLMPGGQKVYNGRFAKILIRSGEIVAAGTLVIDYKMEEGIFSRRFSANSRVESFRPATVASLKKRIPATLAKARKSPLIMLTDQEKREGLASAKR
jgi:hypothetical protein